MKNKIFAFVITTWMISITAALYYVYREHTKEPPSLSMSEVNPEAEPNVGENYVLCYSIEDRTKGFVNISYGGVPLRGRGGVAGENPVTYDIWVGACGSITALSPDTLQVTPSEEFDGNFAISVNQIAQPNPPMRTNALFGDAKALEVRVGVRSSYFIGANAGSKEFSAIGSNVALGANALANVITGDANIGIGTRALYSLTGAKSNVAVGNNTLQKNGTGYNNTAVGTAALETNTTGFDNVGLGIRALALNETGNNNTALGTDSFEENISGSHNTGIGTYSARLNKTSSANTIGGFGAMYRYTGRLGQNTAFGMNALGYLVEGGNNIAIGVNAGLKPTSALNSIWIGLDSGKNDKQADGLSNSIALGASSWTDKDNQISLGNEKIKQIRTWGVVTFKESYDIYDPDIEPNSLFVGHNGMLYFKTGDSITLPLTSYGQR